MLATGWPKERAVIGAAAGIARFGENGGGLKHFRAERGGVAHGLRDLGEDAQGQVAPFGVDARAGGGIDLHERNLGAAGLEFLQPVGVFLNLLHGRFLAMDGG